MKKIMMSALLICLVFSLTAVSGSVLSSGGEKFKVREIEPFSYCYLPCKGSFTGMQDQIGLLMQSIQGQNIVPTGPMLGVYHNDPATTKPEDLQWEIGFPVIPETEVQDPLRLKRWEFTMVVEAQYTGPYEKSGEMYGELMSWMEANGLVPTGPFMEKYLSDPESTRPDDLQTEIWVPCKKK